MLANMNTVQENAGQISLPMLLLHGGKDSLAAVEGSEFLDRHISSSEKQLKIYPEKHTILNDMTDWLDKQLAARGT
jgi:esterase/lipase